MLNTVSGPDGPDFFNRYFVGYSEVEDFLNPYACNDCDINNDCMINVLDVLSTIQIILGNILPSECESLSADANNDGSINITDIVALVNAILSP